MIFPACHFNFIQQQKDKEKSLVAAFCHQETSGGVQYTKSALLLTYLDTFNGDINVWNLTAPNPNLHTFFL